MLIILWMKYCLYLRLMMTMSEEDPGIIEDGYQYAKRNRYIAAPYCDKRIPKLHRTIKKVYELNYRCSDNCML